MTKVLIVGQAPGRSPGVVLGGRCGRRIAALAGITLDEFLERTERVNLLSYYPGKDGKGDAFPMDEARREAARLMSRLLAERHHRPIVLLGCNVAKAFHFKEELFAWGQCYSHSLVAAAPHPSGVSRWWNSPESVEAARTFWRETIHRST